MNRLFLYSAANGSSGNGRGDITLCKLRQAAWFCSGGVAASGISREHRPTIDPADWSSQGWRMQRNGNGPSVGWTTATLPYPMAAGIEWRLHMSTIAAQIDAVPAGPRAARDQYLTDEAIDERVWTRRMQRRVRELRVDGVAVTA